jgi:hypothetical protein
MVTARVIFGSNKPNPAITIFKHSFGPKYGCSFFFTNVLRAKGGKIWKYRGMWVLVLEISRHTPIALGTSGALGWNAPRSIKIGHAHIGTILRPPGRYFMRQYMSMWAKEEEKVLVLGV